MESEFIGREALEILHQESIARFGGSLGVRDEGLVLSALAAAENAYWYGHGDLFDIAAAYAFHIARIKRFSMETSAPESPRLMPFLRLNGVTTTPNQMALYDAMIAIAEKRLDKAELAARFRELFG